MQINKYEQLSLDRKKLQRNEEAPKWLTTAGYQLLTNNNYLLPGETPKDMYNRAAKRAAELVQIPIPPFLPYTTWYDAFYTSMWNGWLSPSTSVLSNLGTNRGHPVSCSGSYMEDSIYSFYETRKEIALLTKEGYGTSVTLDTVRHRGASISVGGTASGVMQPASGIVQDMKEVSQGFRRGNCGLYLNPLHNDAEELMDQLLADDSGWNVGWNFTNEFDELLEKDPQAADYIWKKLLRTKLIKGKGYYLFLDKANSLMPQCFKDNNLTIHNSNLCAEIMLPNDKNHTFSCVLSSLNVTKYDEWKDKYLYEIALVFANALIDDMLEKSHNKPGFERIVQFTEKARAIGLGILGLSTYYQQNNWVFGDLNSIMFNQQLAREMQERTYSMSEYMASILGEPEWCKGSGRYNATTMAFPPTMSTSAIMGGVSQGIEPVFANVYEQDTAGGMVYRINPPLLKLMKEREVYNEETMKRIAENQGSVFGEDWLSDYEKEVFRTAFELNQETILLMASHRQKWIDQGQSLNLYFKKETPEEYISKLHWIAYKDPYIKSLYYIRTLNEDEKLTIPESVCTACNG